MERAVLTISPIHSEDWRTEIISFLQGNCLLDDEVYNKRMEARTRPYVIIEGELYKHGVCSPLLKCFSRNEGQELMKEIHAGLCGAHIGSMPLLGKVFRQGFYWPKRSFGCSGLGPEIRKLTKMCQRPETTFVFNTIDSTYLAITEMGPRFGRTASTSTRKLKIYCSSDGIFLKVD
jgi:hypothetical protein